MIALASSLRNLNPRVIARCAASAYDSAMSITKRYLEGDPSIRRGPDDREAVSARIDAYPHKLQGRKKSREPKGPTWDPFWPGAVDQAERELGIASINVNGAFRYATVDDRNAVKRRAEECWPDRRNAFLARTTKS